jgi:hypothetical protein
MATQEEETQQHVAKLLSEAIAAARAAFGGEQTVAYVRAVRHGLIAGAKAFAVTLEEQPEAVDARANRMTRANLLIERAQKAETGRGGTTDTGATLAILRELIELLRETL